MFELMQLQCEILRQSVSLSAQVMNVWMRNQPRLVSALSPPKLGPRRPRPAFLALEDFRG
ncbi:MAG: hypothetical protein EA405_14285 [Rhodospirillales bacterium]|nr:MAG: hypothetical protein EA405_14285 [Rhodospirillales bacterium]TVR99038.1 MAG: hypothetical protein EA406_04855 [Rhodospirillales bacterium]